MVLEKLLTMKDYFKEEQRTTYYLWKAKCGFFSLREQNCKRRIQNFRRVIKYERLL